MEISMKIEAEPEQRCLRSEGCGQRWQSLHFEAAGEVISPDNS